MSRICRTLKPLLARLMVLGTLQAVPEETKKGGASHEISSNGIWSTGDPKLATREFGEKAVNRMVDAAVQFIKAWKMVMNT